MQGFGNYTRNTILKTTEDIFSCRPAVYSVQLLVKPVLWRRLLGCFAVTLGNLVTALPFTLQHQMAPSNTFIHSFPSKRKLHWHVNNFHTTDSCQRKCEGEHIVFGKNFRLHRRTYRRISMEIFVARGQFVNWFGEQVWIAEGVRLIRNCTGEGDVRLNGLVNTQKNNTGRKIITQY
jgi:hypothetical protein